MADKVVLNATQIGRLAGVAGGTAATWRRHRDDFPAPAGDSPGGAVYDPAEVEAWLAAAGRWELAPGSRVWREVSHVARGGSLREAVLAAAAVAARHGTGEGLPPGVPGNLAWLIGRAVDDVGAAAVLNDLLDRYATASGIPVTPARIAECMISLAGIGDGATVLDPASGTAELLAAALARGAGHVLAQDPGDATGELARARLLPAKGQGAEVAAGDALSADAFPGREADAVICRPPTQPAGQDPATAWARYALAHLKPGGRAVLALPPSAAAAPSGREDRKRLLRQGVLRTVIALPVAVAPPYVPLHLWVLERPGGAAEPDPTALFVDAAPDGRGGADYATSAAAGTMPAARWRAFLHTMENAENLPGSPGRRAVATGAGRNARWSVTRVADLLDDTGVLDESERLDETVDLTPARVRAHFFAWHREKDKESARRRPAAGPVNPAATFRDARLERFLIARDIDAATAILQRMDWLGDPRSARGADPQPGLPAGPWRMATVPELARLGLLRYRRAGTGSADLLRAGDVLVPAAGTDGAGATVVGADDDGDPAGPGVHVIRPHPAHLNAWYLAGFLLPPGTPRRATGNRVDVRQLAVPLLPLADQERYASMFRGARSLAAITARLKDRGESLAGNLTTGLISGDFRPGPPAADSV